MKSLNKENKQHKKTADSDFSFCQDLGATCPFPSYSIKNSEKKCRSSSCYMCSRCPFVLQKKLHKSFIWDYLVYCVRSDQKVSDTELCRQHMGSPHGLTGLILSPVKVMEQLLLILHILDEILIETNSKLMQKIHDYPEHLQIIIAILKSPSFSISHYLAQSLSFQSLRSQPFQQIAFQLPEVTMPLDNQISTNFIHLELWWKETHGTESKAHWHKMSLSIEFNRIWG